MWKVTHATQANTSRGVSTICVVSSTLIILYLGHKCQHVIDRASTRRAVLVNIECLSLVIQRGEEEVNVKGMFVCQF